MTAPLGYDDGAADALELAGLIAERAVGEDDPVGFIRRRIETLRLEVAFRTGAASDG